MRFVPHRDPALQTSAGPLSPEYCSDSEAETSSDEDRILSTDSAQNLLEGENTSDTSDASSTSEGEDEDGRPEESLDALPEFLSTQGLEKRFQLACSLAESHRAHTFSPESEDGGDNYIEYDRQPDDVPSSTSSARPETLTKFFISRFTDERAKRRDTVNHLLSLEEERIRKEEEEKKRQIEEQRRKEEEAARRKQEEAEKLRLEQQRIKEEQLRRAQEQEKARQEKLRKEEEARVQREKDKAAAAEKAAAMAKETALKRAKEEAARMVVRPAEIESQYQKYMQDLKDIDAQVVQPMNANKDLKRAAGGHKRKINPKFGQLTNSESQIGRITSEIRQLVEQTRANGDVYKWILNFVSDAIISQAETEVSVKPSASVPLAKLTLNLLILFDDLLYFMLAKFYSSCPFLLGYSCSQDTEEGRLRLGWSRDADTGKWEIEEQHNERLCGIATLYSVITRLKLDSSYVGYDPSSTRHPLPIRHSWIFLARMMDVPTSELSETHYAIVGAWWDACCAEFLAAYGRQSQKLLRLVAGEWTSVGGTSSAGRVRLRLLGEEWMKGSVKTFPAVSR